MSVFDVLEPSTVSLVTDNSAEIRCGLLIEEVLESINCLWVCMDVIRVIIKASNALINALGPEEPLIGKKFLDFIHPNEVTNFSAFLSDNDKKECNTKVRIFKPLQNESEQCNFQYQPFHVFKTFRSSCEKDSKVVIIVLILEPEPLFEISYHNFNRSELFFKLRMDLEILFVDQRSAAILGHLPHEMVKKSFTSFIFPDDVILCFYWFWKVSTSDRYNMVIRFSTTNHTDVLYSKVDGILIDEKSKVNSVMVKTVFQDANDQTSEYTLPQNRNDLIAEMTKANVLIKNIEELPETRKCITSPDGSFSLCLTPREQTSSKIAIVSPFSESPISLTDFIRALLTPAVLEDPLFDNSLSPEEQLEALKCYLKQSLPSGTRKRRANSSESIVRELLCRTQPARSASTSPSLTSSSANNDMTQEYASQLAALDQEHTAWMQKYQTGLAALSSRREKLETLHSSVDSQWALMELEKHESELRHKFHGLEMLRQRHISQYETRRRELLELISIAGRHRSNPVDESLRSYSSHILRYVRIAMNATNANNSPMLMSRSTSSCMFNSQQFPDSSTFDQL